VFIKKLLKNRDPSFKVVLWIWVQAAFWTTLIGVVFVIVGYCVNQFIQALDVWMSTKWGI